MHGTRLYRMLIQPVQHAIIQHKHHKTRLYNMLIKHANRKIKIFEKRGREKVK